MSTSTGITRRVQDSDNITRDDNAIRRTTETDPDDDTLPTDSDSDDIHAKLKALRLDEVPGLSQSPTNRRTVNAADSYIQLIFLETGRYIRFVYSTLTYVVATTFFGGLGLFDLFSIWFFAIGGIIVLYAALIFCLSARFPVLVRIYFWWSDRFGGGLGLVNAGNPNLFKAMTQDQAAAAKEGLSKSYKDSPSTVEHRYFDLDIAKMLLQIASVVYEHECDAIREAVAITASKPPSSMVPTQSAATVHSSLSSAPNLGGIIPAHKPGALVSDLWTVQVSRRAAAALDSEPDQHIRDFVAEFGLDFEPISELNNTSSAFAGLFWDPKSNWIVVSFKGTAPLEFGEWLSDLNTKLVDCADAINGFSKCHLGFKDRVFPENVANLGGSKPYETIALGIKTLAKWLKKHNNLAKETKVNVWFTGHSLGCAVASLVYSRMLVEDKDIGKHAVLRDAYLFAAPILTDRPSVDAFNHKMTDKKHELKTMWRITSNGDLVATALPDLGDRRHITVSPNNAFAFAHLGSELIMKNHPMQNNVSGHHILYGSPVSVYSKFNPQELADQRKTHDLIPHEQGREALGVLLQKIPLLGRGLAHLTIFYWDQLHRIGVGKCDWVVV